MTPCKKSKALLKLMQSSRHWFLLSHKAGWTERRAEAPSQLKASFPFREELSTQDGVVFKVGRIVVPSNLMQCMMNKVHASHLGIQGCPRRAKEAFYWPGIYKQITNSSQGAAFATATYQSSRKNL